MDASLCRSLLRRAWSSSSCIHEEVEFSTDIHVVKLTNCKPIRNSPWAYTCRARHFLIINECLLNLGHLPFLSGITTASQFSNTRPWENDTRHRPPKIYQLWHAVQLLYQVERCFFFGRPVDGSADAWQCSPGDVGYGIWRSSVKWRRFTPRVFRSADDPSRRKLNLYILITHSSNRSYTPGMKCHREKTIVFQCFQSITVGGGPRENHREEGK